MIFLSRSSRPTGPRGWVASFVGLALTAILTVSGCGAEGDHAVLEAARRSADADVAAQTAMNIATDRKIIHTGELRLAVKALDETEQEIKRLLSEAGGQVADFREERSQGNHRAGRWKVRVPPAKFAQFVEGVAGLGMPELRSVQAADVTEEYIDIEARLKNKRQLEARILKLLDEKTGEIKDVVAVETELARIREEIERIEGRLRYLTNQIDLSTVAIYAFEREEYQPPATPNLRERIATVFYGSLRSLGEAGEHLLLLVVALVPWAVVALIVFAGCWFVCRIVWWAMRPSTR